MHMEGLSWWNCRLHFVVQSNHADASTSRIFNETSGKWPNDQRRLASVARRQAKQRQFFSSSAQPSPITAIRATYRRPGFLYESQGIIFWQRAWQTWEVKTVAKNLKTWKRWKNKKTLYENVT